MCKKTFLLLLIASLSLCVFSKTYMENKIYVTEQGYQNDLDEVWNIDLGQNVNIVFDCLIDIEGYGYDILSIFDIDENGEENLIIAVGDDDGEEGYFEGVVSTSIPNGKAKVVFQTDGSVSNYGGNGFAGVMLDYAGVITEKLVETNGSWLFAELDSYLYLGNAITSQMPSLSSSFRFYETNDKTEMHLGEYASLSMNKNVTFGENVFEFTSSGKGGAKGSFSFVTDNGNTDANEVMRIGADGIIETKGIWNNSGGSYSSMRLGEGHNDRIYADNSDDKYYGGGIWFRVHNESLNPEGEVWQQYVDALMISEDGDVGIGDRSPDEKLAVNGNIQIPETNHYLKGGNWNYWGTCQSGYGYNAMCLRYVDNQWDSFHPSINGMAMKFVPNGIDFVTAAPNTQPAELSTILRIKADNTVLLDGKLFANEIEIKADVWADFVFDEDYVLSPLSEVERHINEKGHLPNVPSESEVLENGIDLAKMNATLLQKVEELTLYIIDQQKQIDELKQGMNQ